MNFNICIVRPEGYVHSSAFAELAELVGYGLLDLGHSVAIRVNRLPANERNIVIGCHLLDPSMIDGLPGSTIIINTEQLPDDSTAWNETIFRWVRRFETWDYNERNLARLVEVGAHAPRLLRLGFHGRLARIGKPERQDIDVLFYGTIGERRRKVIDALRKSGCKVEAVFGVYGQERDRLIARSKVVLNMHHYQSHIFEIVRVFYLMTNAKAVVGEIGERTSIDPAYVDGIQGSSHDDLVESCRRLVSDDALRAELEKRALATIAKLPQHELLAPLLS